jgi:hypothetical protein
MVIWEFYEENLEDIPWFCLQVKFSFGSLHMFPLMEALGLFF